MQAQCFCPTYSGGGKFHLPSCPQIHPPELGEGESSLQTTWFQGLDIKPHAQADTHIRAPEFKVKGIGLIRRCLIRIGIGIQNEMC